MASNNTRFVIEAERRLCFINNEIGYFHCWEQFSQLRTSSFGNGEFKRIYGIVEFKNRVERVEIDDIKFVDEENAFLIGLQNKYKGYCEE